MFSNKRKTIGVMVEAVSNDFPNLICQGIIRSANKLGYNVAIFSAYSKYGSQGSYLIGNYKIYDLAPYEDLDGIILLLDTIQNHPTIEHLLAEIDSRCHCPIVSIREKVPGANNFLIDNSNCVEKIVRHFIEEHHFTKLCFMTGPEDRWYSQERLDCFLRLMKEYDLPVGEHQVFYGDFWTNMGPQACDWFLNGQERPEAIICANDHMATAVASELIHRGYEIPKDICVSGYDGLKDTAHFSPSISTVALPFTQMGERAVEVIEQQQKTPNDVDDYYFDVKLVTRESCGCQHINDQEVIITRRNYHERTRTEHNRHIQFNFLSTLLGECTTFDEISEGMAQYISNLSGYRDYAVCFCNKLEDRKSFRNYSNTMELRIGFHSETRMESARIPFPRTQLLPAEITSDAPQAWYFSPVHVGSNTYGYEAIQFWNTELTGNVFFDWTTIVSNKVHDILNQQKMKSLIDELQYMYNRDALTGLYNRRGFEGYADLILHKSKENQEPVFFAIVDMDGMKQINDIYGHVAGDHALTTVSAAIQFACGDQLISARTGGDEFVIVAGNVNEKTGTSCLDTIQKRLDEYNDSGEKPYQIHVSFGHVCRIASPEDSVETFMKDSDEIMYKNKVENKRRRNEPLR